VGNDGWITDKGAAWEQLPDTDKIAEADLGKSIELIKRLQYHLEKKGIKFAVVVIPLVSTVYPEKFVRVGVPLRSSTGIDRFQSALSSNGIAFIDAQAVLREKGKTMPMYYRTDIHLNTYGAYWVSRRILEHFYREYGIPAPEFDEPVATFVHF